MRDFLNDKIFLDKLDHLKIKEQLIKLTILSWSEESICEIQGKALSGSLNIDGSSSMRRTGNLVVYADKKFNDLTNLNNDIAINRKVKIELGIRNIVPKEEAGYFNEYGTYIERIINYQDLYGDVVWFPLGTFVIFNPNISYSLEGVTISLTLQDKMCLLNGNAGGVIPAAVTFSESEYVDDDGNTVIEHPTIYQIIEELVNHFGEEKLANILITDLSETVKQVVKYIGYEYLYYVDGIRQDNSQRFQMYYTNINHAEEAKAQLQEGASITTYKSGQDIGFREVPFEYPGELTCGAGDTITSVLDNIIKILGNFEYFYDIDGIFHFQEIKNYMNTTYTEDILRQLNTDVDYKVDFSKGKSVYNFKGTELIININNTPNWDNIKNDFVIWGKRKGIDNVEYPIRYHLAIDRRPKLQYDENNNPYYGQHDNIILEKDEFNNWVARKGNTGEGISILTKDYREELYYQGIEPLNRSDTDTPYYFTELVTEFPKIYDLQQQQFKEEIINDPSSLDFFLDIIDSGAEIGKYSVETIGRRSKVIEEDEINCIFEYEIPDLVFINPKDKDYIEHIAQLQSRGQDYYQIDDAFESLLANGGTLNSAYYRMSELLYENTNLNSTINISSIPIYYLEPNTRITINNEQVGVSGDYVIQSISLPLDISSVMDISAYKAIERL